MTDQAANQTVCKCEYEKRGLHYKLQNDKLGMEKESAKVLDGIRFRYQELRHQVLGLEERDQKFTIIWTKNSNKFFAIKNQIMF